MILLILSLYMRFNRYGAMNRSSVCISLKVYIIAAKPNSIFQAQLFCQWDLDLNYEYVTILRSFDIVFSLADKMYTCGLYYM